MTWKRSVLVVANVTASSKELADALKERTAGESTTFALVIPATRGRAAAGERLAEALDYLHDQGLEVEGSVGHTDPLVAVIEAWHSWAPRRDHRLDAPGGHLHVAPRRASHRIEKLTGASVSHVVSRPPPPPVQLTDPRAHGRSGVAFDPISILRKGPPWGDPLVHHPRQRRSPSTRSSMSTRRTHQAARRWFSSTAYGCYPAAGTDGRPSLRRLVISRSPPVGPTTRRR